MSNEDLVKNNSWVCKAKHNIEYMETKDMLVMKKKSVFLNVVKNVNVMKKNIQPNSRNVMKMFWVYLKDFIRRKQKVVHRIIQFCHSVNEMCGMCLCLS